MLAPGSRGGEVAELQRELAAAGFGPGPVDGIFGPRTRGAVERLQEYCGLAVTGSAGQATRQALGLLLPHPAQPGRRLSPHFTEGEFRCRCCGVVRLNMRLLSMLEQLRANLGHRPVVITSGYRCPGHNRAVGGAPNSQHLLGNAADIVVPGVDPVEVANGAGALGFPGVGKYAAFTHVDVRPGGAARW